MALVTERTLLQVVAFTGPGAPPFSDTASEQCQVQQCGCVANRRLQAFVSLHHGFFPTPSSVVMGASSPRPRWAKGDGRLGGGCCMLLTETLVDRNQSYWEPLCKRSNRLLGWGILDGVMDDEARRQVAAKPVPVRAWSPGAEFQVEPPGNNSACADVQASVLNTVSSSGDLCSSEMGVCESVVGVLGGGQLGRMLAQAASPLAIRVAVLDPAPDAPASSIAHRHVVGSFRDTEAVREFASGCDVLTVEIEHVDVDSLDALAAEGVDVEPKPSTIRTIQDKYVQKVHFSKHGVPLPEFMRVTDRASALEAGQQFGYPLMIKTRRLAYDGRGNAVAWTEKEVESAISSLGGFERGLFAEKWAPFEKELAVMVARGRDGTLRSYPVVETTHKDNICHTVLAPAPVPSQVAATAMSVAEKAIGSLEGAGVFGVELFLLPGGEVLLNEVAPRPHNSGHYTIEGCVTSQYEQHLRAVLGLPLGDTSMRLPCAMMLNILGEEEGEAGFRIVHEVMARALEVAGASVHWYGKQEIRRQRKMGHITVVGKNLEIVRDRMARIQGGCRNQDTGIEGRAMSQPEGVGSSDSEGLAPPVGIIMGSDSDLPVMKAAAEVLDDFGILYELTVVSAHRTPQRMFDYAKDAHRRGVKVVIAGAGGAAHLPGMVAAMTPLPVIGVPVRGSSLDGLDSLLSIVQMPRGVPVATVAINNATNAGLLAARMMGASDPVVQARMEAYQQSMEDAVMEKAGRLETIGWKEYLGGQSSAGGRV